MEISGNYVRKYFKESIAGTFHPVFLFQGGSAFELNLLTWKNIPVKGTLIYAVGTGFQFYNEKILNEIFLKFNQYFTKHKSISIELSIYWK